MFVIILIIQFNIFIPWSMNKLNTFIKCMNGQMNLYLYALHSPSPKNIISTLGDKYNLSLVLICTSVYMCICVHTEIDLTIHTSNN